MTENQATLAIIRVRLDQIARPERTIKDSCTEANCAWLITACYSLLAIAEDEIQRSSEKDTKSHD
jgi:hypothetical protein